MNKGKIADFEGYITKNDKINENYYLLGISRPTNFNAEPGQFINIKIEPQSLEPFLRRPFSVFYIDDYEIGILYQVKGEGTKVLSTKKNGSKLDVIGPLGKGFPVEFDKLSTFDVAFFIGGGIGIAPLIFYAKTLKESLNFPNLFLIYGMRDESYLLPEDYLKYFFSSIFFSFEKRLFYTDDYLTGCSCQAIVGNAIDVLKTEEFNKLLERFKNPLFAVCGPDPMLKSFLRWNELKNYESFLSLESFMGCGFHACLGCAVSKKNDGYLYLCEDGPVVYYKDIQLE